MASFFFFFLPTDPIWELRQKQNKDLWCETTETILMLAEYFVFTSDHFAYIKNIHLLGFFLALKEWINPTFFEPYPPNEHDLDPDHNVGTTGITPGVNGVSLIQLADIGSLFHDKIYAIPQPQNLFQLCGRTQA